MKSKYSLLASEGLSLAALIILYLVVCWDTILVPAKVPLHDNTYYHYPLFAFLVSGLKNYHAIPMWVPYISGGMPTILFSSSWFLWLPSRWPLYLFALLWPGTIDAIALYKWSLIFSHLFIAASFYLLARDFFRNCWVAIWAVLLVLFSGITLTGFCQEQLIASLFYVPLLLFLLLRLYRTGKWSYAFLFSSFFGASLSLHMPHLVIYFLFICLIAFCFAFPKKAARLMTRRKKMLARLLILVPLGVILLGNIPLYNFARYGKEVISPRRGGTLEVSYDQIRETRETNSLSMNMLKAYVFTKTVIGDPDWENTKHLQEDRSPYFIGSVGLGLAFIGLICGWGEFSLFCLIGFALTLQFALGDNSFVYSGLFKFFPFARLQRIPIHMGNYMNVFLILLSCRGMAWILARWEKYGRKRQAVFGLLLLLGFIDLIPKFYYMTPLFAGSRPILPDVQHAAAPNLFPSSRNSALKVDGYWDLLKRSSMLLAFKGRDIDSDWPLYYEPKMDQGDWSMLSNSSTEVKFRTTSTNRTRFLWNVSWHPDWRGFIDGRPFEIFRVANRAMAWELPAGNHEVQLRYSNRLENGLVVFHIAMLTLCFVLLGRNLLSAKKEGDK